MWATTKIAAIALMIIVFGVGQTHLAHPPPQAARG